MLRYWGLLIASASLGSWNFLLIEVGEESFSAGFLSWARIAIAGLALTTFLIPSHRGRSLIHGALSDIAERPVSALLLAASVMAVPFTLLTLGQSHLSASVAGLLITAIPLIAAGLALILDRSERVNFKQLIGLVLGFIGVGMIVGFETVSSTGEFLGALLVLGAAVSWAFSGYVIKLRYSKAPVMQTTLVACFVGTILTLPLAFIHPPAADPLMKSTLAIVAQGIFCTALLYTINNIVLTKAGVGFFNIVLYIQPVFVVLIGAVFLNDRLAPMTFLGVALVLIGVTIRTRSNQPEVTSEKVNKEPIPEATLRASPALPEIDIQRE